MTKPNRYDTAQNFVPATVTPGRAMASQDVQAALQGLSAGPVEVAIDRVFDAQDGGKEVTSARDRAAGFVVRLAPLTVILLVLAVGLALVARLDLGRSVLIFALLTIAGYYLLTALDFRHSRAGLERHRIDRAAWLAGERMRHEAALRKQAQEGYLRLMEKITDDR